MRDGRSSASVAGAFMGLWGGAVESSTAARRYPSPNVEPRLESKYPRSVEVPACIKTQRCHVARCEPRCRRIRRGGLASCRGERRLAARDTIKLPRNPPSSWRHGAPSARGMTWGEKGTLFVGSLEGRVHAHLCGVQRGWTRPCRRFLPASASKAGLVLLGGALFVSDDGAGAISRIRYRRLRALIRGQAGIGQVQQIAGPCLRAGPAIQDATPSAEPCG